MKSFGTKLVSLIIIVELIVGYNFIQYDREKDEKIARLIYSLRLEEQNVKSAREKDARIESLEQQVGELEELEEAEAQKRLETQKKLEELEKTQKSGNSYEDGTYEGEGTGYGGKIRVKVDIRDGQIQTIEVISAEQEDKSYLTIAKDIITEMISAQSAEVDTISGATMSSTGIKEAVKKALEKAVKENGTGK